MSSRLLQPSNFYSRTSCEVRPEGMHLRNIITGISTHAPLARCDQWRTVGDSVNSISTHAPLARCDFQILGQSVLLTAFLLTHLLRGATLNMYLTFKLDCNFYSRTSCEVRPARSGSGSSDLIFLLTHLLRGATV